MDLITEVSPCPRADLRGGWRSFTCLQAFQVGHQKMWTLTGATHLKEMFGDPSRRNVIKKNCLQLRLLQSSIKQSRDGSDPVFCWPFIWHPRKSGPMVMRAHHNWSGRRSQTDNYGSNKASKSPTHRLIKEEQGWEGTHGCGNLCWAASAAATSTSWLLNRCFIKLNWMSIKTTKVIFGRLLRWNRWLQSVLLLLPWQPVFVE